MRKGHLLFSAVQLIFVLFVVLLGLFLIGLHYAPDLRYRLSLFFSNPPLSFAAMGYLILISGLFLLVGFCSMYKGRYYVLKMGRHTACVDEEALRQAIHLHWQERYPHLKTQIQVHVQRAQALELVLELLPMPVAEQEALLAQLEQELGALLYAQFGYQKEFRVSVLVT